MKKTRATNTCHDNQELMENNGASQAALRQGFQPCGIQTRATETCSGVGGALAGSSSAGVGTYEGAGSHFEEAKDLGP
jgi:hypothetical protein